MRGKLISSSGDVEEAEAIVEGNVELVFYCCWLHIRYLMCEINCCELVGLNLLFLHIHLTNTYFDPLMYQGCTRPGGSIAANELDSVPSLWRLSKKLLFWPIIRHLEM